ARQGLEPGRFLPPLILVPKSFCHMIRRLGLGWTYDLPVFLLVTKIPNPGHGSAVPDLLFTRPMSALSKNPSTLRSSRKFALVTGLPDCDLVCPISAESTNRSALVSPSSTSMRTGAISPLLPAESLTP